MSNNRDTVIPRIQKAYKECLSFSQDHPDIAVSRCRKILEMILVQNHREKAGEPNPKAMRSVELLLEIGLQLNTITPLQALNMRTIQSYGNFGSHFQDGAEDELSYQEIQPCLVATETLLKWFIPDIDMEVFSEQKPGPEPDPLPGGPVNLPPGLPTPDMPDIEQPDENQKVTIRLLLHQLSETLLPNPDDTVRLRNISKWFEENYPDYTRNAVETHVGMMTTNGETRLAHHLKADGSDELFFRVKPGLYRLYRKGEDPVPIIESELNTGWEGKLVVVNTASSFEDVKSSKIYMSPNTGGNYKLQRCKYIGLYKNKTASFIAPVVARVSFHKATSQGFVWWRNDHSIPKSELINIARKEVDKRLNFDYPVQVIVTEPFVKTDFRKTTSGGMVNNNRMFDISRLEHNDINKLADFLQHVSWDEINR
jgi:hypothetical protein